MRRRVGIVVLVALLFIQPVGAAVATGSTSGQMGTGTVESLDRGTFDGHSAGTDETGYAAQTDSSIIRTMTFSLTPSQPGEVDVRMTFSIPDSVESLETGVPVDSTVRSADGFHRDSPNNYTWDGETAGPSITFELPVNETSAYHYAIPDTTRSDTPSSGLTFADTGPWAIVSVPSLSASWTYRGLPAPTFEGRVRTAGEGVAGDRIVFLGPHTEESRTIDDQRITLVVPEAAELEASPDELFASLGHTARSLPVGSKPPRSMFVAAPASVEWGPFGVTEERDAWVRADQPLSDPNNVWIHEYVHIRQDFRTSADARWIFEAMAEYYAASLSLQQGHIGFREFSDHLERGQSDRFEGTVLSRPSTWDPLADYVRGALVFGNIDRRMRISTESRHPASHLLRAMNERGAPVDHAFIRQQVESLSDAETARYVDRYVTTEDAPRMWSRSEHTAAYATLPAILTVEPVSALTVSGPYRNMTNESLPPLVPGERLSVDVLVRNEGDAEGAYEASLEVDGTVGATESVTLEGGENESVTLSHEFTRTGSFEVSVGQTAWNVTVLEPAEPVVTGIEGPTRAVEPGEPIPLGVTVENQADRPATGTVSISVDGSAVETWTPRLDVSETERRTFELTIAEPGTHEIRVGDQSLTVEVGSGATTSQSSDQGATQTTTPGFGVGVAFVGLLLSLALSVRIRAP